MVKMSTFAGIAGMWFIAWQMLQRMKDRASLENYQFMTHTHKPGNNAQALDIVKAQREANGAPSRILNVNNFGLENMEGKKGPPNNLS